MATDEEFRGFSAQHDERLCRLGFLLTGDPAQAEELAQDALVLDNDTYRYLGARHVVTRDHFIPNVGGPRGTWFRKDRSWSQGPSWPWRW